jgi:hypothetical protein
MKQSIVIKRLTAGSLFKSLSVILIPTPIIFSVVAGIHEMFGEGTVTFFNQTLTGIPAFLATVFIGVFGALIGTLSVWIIVAFQFWVFSLFGHLKIDYISHETESEIKRQV